MLYKMNNIIECNKNLKLIVWKFIFYLNLTYFEIIMLFKLKITLNSYLCNLYYLKNHFLFFKYNILLKII